VIPKPAPYAGWRRYKATPRRDRTLPPPGESFLGPQGRRPAPYQGLRIAVIVTGHKATRHRKAGD